MAAVSVFAVAVAYPETHKDENFISTKEYKTILTVWHVDSFEGGIGSRADFLSNALLKTRDFGVITLVKTHTEESVAAAIEKGEMPDLISFGAGCSSAIRLAREMFSVRFKGGEAGGKTYAAPWCFGGYYLIAKSDDNRLIDGFLTSDEKKISEIVVSQGKNTLPVLALKIAGVTAENASYYPPADAYSEFLKRKDVVLLGTQRDLRRLEKRGVGFNMAPLEGYSDLVQYVAITTKSDEKYKYCEEAIKILTGEKTQSDLYKIGMMRTDGKENSGAEFYGYDFSKNEYTLSPFLSDELIASAKKELNEKKTDVKISENVKSGLKYLK